MQPQSLQTISQIAILVGVIVTALGGYGAYHFGRVLDRQKDVMAEAREKELRDGLDAVVAGNEKLEAGNQLLQEQLAPFRDLATRIYPGIESDAALGRLFKEIDQLRSRATALESRTAPRRLNTAASERIAGFLRSKGTRTVPMTCVMGDSEGFQFALDLKNAIEAAGWRVDGVNQAIFNGPTQGLIVKIKSTPAPPEANWLMDAFKQIGLEPKGVQNADAEPGSFEIIVGTKD